ncbi:MAG: DNA-binding domain-containing protein [Gammaproteobacteria bacterium]|nr:DNA-binding domain-containing protein [Gammaproteobacteria bacterium]
MSQLQHIQELFMHAIFNGSEDNPAINELGKHLTHNNRLSPQQQIAIYRDSVFGSLSTALAQIYPVCKKLVGADFFDFMAVQYIKNHYSVSPDLADYGKQLAIFIENFKPASVLPYLADVTRLEWAWHRAFHSIDHDGMNINRLTQVSEHAQQSLIFKLPPGSKLISSPYPIDTIWLANQNTNESDNIIHLDQGKVKLLVWRKQYDIRIDSLNDDEWLFLSAIKNKRTFIDICDHFEHIPGIDIAALMPRCVQLGWIADFAFGESK